METLIVNKATKGDIELLIAIAKKIGMDVEVAPRKSESPSKDKVIKELSRKVNSSLHNKYIRPIIDDSYSRQ